MAHVRKQIRDAAQALLLGMPTYNSNVFVARPDERPLPYGITTAWRIYTDEEAIEALAIERPSALLRGLTLKVEAIAVAGGATPVQDTLDAMTSAFEAAISADWLLGGRLKSSELSRIDTDISADGERAVGIQRHTVDLQYMTLSTAPETAI